MTGAGAGSGTPAAAAPGDGGRAVPYACPFCAEEDLRPVPGGRWHCRSCLRVFSLHFHGLSPASGRAPVPRPDPSTAPSARTERHP